MVLSVCVKISFNPICVMISIMTNLLNIIYHNVFILLSFDSFTRVLEAVVVLSWFHHVIMWWCLVILIGDLGV